jgi:hypothetical protein
MKIYSKELYLNNFLCLYYVFIRYPFRGCIIIRYQKRLFLLSSIIYPSHFNINL